MQTHVQTAAPPRTHTLWRRVAMQVSRACLIASGAVSLCAQTVPPTGPQQLAFAGLRATVVQGIPQGQINAIRVDPQGNLYLLIDQKDGVRVLKTDPAAGNVLAQAQLGAAGDIGTALALDGTGNVYITGTTSSDALTATSGAAFLTPSGTSINSFVAKFDANLNTVFVTFCGGGFMAADSIAVSSGAIFITGSIFAATLPVNPAGIIQTPASGSTQNGFVESFAINGSALRYATYLSGAGGNTSPAAIAADAAGDAFVAGTTTAPGYPTIAAVVPAILASTSGFLTRLTPAGDGIAFSTFVPGAGITSLALDPVVSNLLLSGSVNLGQFPITSVQTPLAPVGYQVLARFALDGSSVLASTVLAPGTQSFVTAAPAGAAWIDGALGLPLLPLTPLANFGNSFAVRVNAANTVDQAARFGGLPATNPVYAGAPVNLTSLSTDAAGNPWFAGSFQPSASQGLLATQTFDLPLENAPTNTFPSTVHSALVPPSACGGSLCPGSASYLARLSIPANLSVAKPSLALSVDDSPNLTLRNLGSGQATALQIASTGFNFNTNCGATLAAGGECSIALSGSGPGSITVSATNAAAQTQSLPALVAGVQPTPILFSPKELDFGIVSSASGPVTRTITVTNLTQQNQTFASALNISAKSTLPYTIAEQSSDCPPANSGAKQLAPDGACHITLGLTASNVAANDGPIQQAWLIGARSVQLSAYGQAAALSVSAPIIDFGTQIAGGLRLPRYLYLSNSSTTTFTHAAVTLPGSSPFALTDRCPSVLEPHTVCQIQLAYQSTRAPAADSVTLDLDQGLTVLVTGRSLPRPAANASSVNPNLALSATSLTFATPVPVTGVSSSTQTLTVQNTGATAFPLSLSLAGDFTYTTNCGATLPGGSSCSLVLSFAPSQPATRQGLLAVTAGANSSPAYVTLTGAGTAILAPFNNGTIDFGSVIVGQPAVQWIKVSQPFTSLSVATSSNTFGTPFTALLVEDIGYGHGQPPASVFSTSVSGTCFNCWLGLRFKPVTTGIETGTLTPSSTATGNPYVLALTGNGLPLTGILITPVAQDFGPVPVNSVSGPSLFIVTNLAATQAAVTVSPPTVTGDFGLATAPSGGASCGGALAYTASCSVEIVFAPTAAGPRSGTLTVQAANTSATASLTGFGSADPRLALNPTALVFNNVPGLTSTQQTLTLTNTSGAVEQIGTPVAFTSNSTASSFTAASSCATLAPAAACAITVTFTPASGPSASVLTIPVTSLVGGLPISANYAVPLTGAYTTEDAGLQIIPADVLYGPQATGAPGLTRQFTIANLTAKSLSLTIALPRQFVLAGAPCAGLAPNASCNFTVTFLPLTNGDITGTLFAQGTPSDGSATLNGIGYVQGYGLGQATLAITGGLQPGRLLNFGQVPSGQRVQKTLTLTNTSSTLPLTIRRITSGWPFMATSTCGATLAPSRTCTVTVNYTPLNQVALGVASPPTTTDAGTLVIESDAGSAPDIIDLTGSSTPLTVASPSDVAPLAALTASQSSLTFDSTMAGNVSAPQTITLANTGNATLHILGLQVASDFTVSSTCSTLVPGSSCVLIVTFTPQNTSPLGATGNRISAIEIASDASTPLEFISLIGAASPSTLTLSQAVLNFGTVLVGNTSTLPVQITNTGASPVTFGVVSATGDYSAGGSCPPVGLALAPATSCTVQVSFAPTASGPRAGTLSVATSASTLPLTVALTGTGAQSQLQISPASLAFGPIAVGSPASLSLTLANTGTAPVTGIALSLTGDYAATVPCAVSTLAPGGSCSVTVTFTPTATGPRPGTLTVVSSDSSSPDSVPLSGTGIVGGTFSLTVDGGASASDTVKTGSPAVYSLVIAPVNGFSGTVVLNCTPVDAATYAYCSLLPSSVTLNGAPQNATATLNTVTSIALEAAPRRRSFSDTALCLLLPGMLLAWKARTSRHRAWRKAGPMAWAFVATLALLSSSGCGHNNANPNLRYASPGTYQYQVSASSVSGAIQITQTVTLNLTIQ